MNKEELQSFYNAVFDANEEKVREFITDNVIYLIHGGPLYEGKPGFSQMMKDMGESGMAQVKIKHLVSDDQHGAVTGILTLSDQSQMSFCEFLSFSENSKIERIESYAAPLEMEE